MIVTWSSMGSCMLSYCRGWVRSSVTQRGRPRQHDNLPRRFSAGGRIAALKERHTICLHITWYGETRSLQVTVANGKMHRGFYLWRKYCAKTCQHWGLSAKCDSVNQSLCMVTWVNLGVGNRSGKIWKLEKYMKNMKNRRVSLSNRLEIVQCSSNSN